ncbi:MAG: CARDB domain-containing protein, partial [Acidobacteriota bacterium]
SNAATLNPATATPLATIAHGSILKPGLSYTASADVTLPACVSGALYLFVFTDSRNRVFEFDPNYDAEANNHSPARPIQIAAIPPDLRVASLTGPATVSAGQPFAISWMVTNQGGPTLETTWTDRLYLSPTPTLDVNTVLLVAEYQHTGSLAQNATYSRTENPIVPTRAQGLYYLIVVTDAGDVVEECANDGNNAQATAATLNVSNNLPDLIVASINPLAAPLAGQTISISWMGKNTGTVAAQNSAWNDAIYLSADQTPSGDDRLLAKKLINGPLAINAIYNGQAQVTIPVIAAGTYYIIVVADAENFVFEGQRESNNASVQPIQVQTPSVDLRVTAVDAPAQAFSGTAVTINWTVNNAGSAQTLASQWTDNIILSRDQILDVTDQVIGYLVHNGALNGGASYNATLNVEISLGLSGPYYVFVRTDANNTLAEPNEENNSGYDTTALNLQIPPPADLLVVTINGPGTGTPGENETLSWMVKNMGSNAAVGQWTDAIYLSANQTWDIGDAEVGRVDRSGPLPAEQSYTGNLTAKLPAVSPGSYYVIVRTDVRNRVREADENNNTAASIGRMSVDVPTLTLGVPRNSTLQTGQERFYKVNVPGNETLRLSLDGQSSQNFNELFARFGLLPSRSAYEFLYNHPYEPDQEIVVPETKAGTYYSSARGAYVPNGTDPFSIKAEILPFSISSVSPNRGGNQGETTIRIRGAKFSQITDENSPFAGTRVFLVSNAGNGRQVKPVWAEAASSSEIYATFDLRGVPPGKYSVRALAEGFREKMDISDGILKEERVILAGAVLPDAFEIVAGGGPSLSYSFLTPSTARFGSKYSILLEVRNDGNVDVPVPVIQVTSPSGVPLGKSLDVRPSSSSQIQVMVLGKGRRDILVPGEQMVVQLYAIAPIQSKSTFITKNLSAKSSEIVNWDVLQTYYRNRLSYPDWPRVWVNFRTIVGDTWGSLHDAMRKIALASGPTPQSGFYSGSELILQLFAKASSGDLEFFDYDKRLSSRLSFNFERRVVSFANPNPLQVPNLADALLLTEQSKVFDNATLPCPNPDDPGCKGCVLPNEFQRLHDKQQIFIGFLHTIPAPPYAIAEPSTISLVQARYPLDWEEVIKPVWKDRYLGSFNTPGPGGSIDAPDSHPISEIAKRTSETQVWMDYIVRAVKETLASNPPKELCDAKGETEIDIEKLVDNFVFGNDPQAPLAPILEAKIKWDFLRSSFGFLVGGAGSSNFGPDTRRVTGKVKFTKHSDCHGRLTSVNAAFDLTVEVQDAFDNCPGAGIGAILNELSGIGPMKRLETFSDFSPVKLKVTFKIKREEANIEVKCRQSCNTSSVDAECQRCDSVDSPSSCPKVEKCETCPGDNNDGGAEKDCDGENDEVNNVGAIDPNDKIGPSGFGPLRFIAVGQTLPYNVRFENQSIASAWARRVSIADQLDPNLDRRTFRLKEVGFGSYRIPIPDNQAFFQGRIQLGPDLGNMLADISAGLDIATGQVFWTLTAIDPNTGEQSNSAALGLLPPNDDIGRGQGYVTYTVQPRADKPTGTQISNKATIIFDTNEPIVTNTVTNTLDADAPVSAIAALP